MKKTLEKIGKGIKKNIGKTLGIGALALASFLPMSQKVEAQEPTEAYQYIEYPFSRPTTSQPTGPLEDLNWYGSGDVNRDEGEANIINQKDVDRLGQIINGTFSDPNDNRLYARSDVDGSGGIPNSQDKTILQNFVNGTIPYLPGDWNKMQTEAEKREWFQKLVNLSGLDKTCDDKLPGDTCDCTQFSGNATMQFSGITEKEKEMFLNRLPYKYHYDTSKNRLYNLPVFEMSIQYYNSNGENQFGHDMNTIALENLPAWESLCNYEPQFNHINVQIGEDYLYDNYAKAIVDIKGPPELIVNNELVGSLTGYFSYDIKNKIPTLTWVKPTSQFKVITQKDSDGNPEVNVTSPQAGKTYITAPQFEMSVSDESIFDMYKWKDDIFGGEKIYYNNQIWASVDSGKTWASLFNYTNRNIETVFRDIPKYENGIGEGNKELWIKAKDMQGNETFKKIPFKIGPSALEDIVKDNTLKVYKDVDGNVNVDFELEHYGKVYSELYNTLGVKLDDFSGKLGAGPNKIEYNMDDKPSGVYIVKLKSSDGEVHTGKIVKE
jgi:hypothetical protein